MMVDESVAVGRLGLAVEVVAWVRSLGLLTGQLLGCCWTGG